MPLAIVTGMELQPNACLLCGSNPLDENNHQQKCIFAEGVDIDWGNAVYICLECGQLIADLMGRSTKEGFDKVSQDRDYWKEMYETLLEEHSAQQELVDKIREGANARRQVISQE